MPFPITITRSVSSAPRFTRFAAATFIAIASWSAAAAPGASDAPVTPAVGVRTVAATPTAPAMVLWYPTRTAEVPFTLGTTRITGARDAPPTAGPYPLVVFSHGSGGTHLSHWKTAHHLAAHGHLVATLLHAGDNAMDPGGSSSLEVWQSRPIEWRSGLDAVLASPLGPLVDRNRIAAAGFSAGGYTALAVGGARPSSRALATYCTHHRSGDVMCPPAAMPLWGRIAGWFGEPAEQLGDTRDHRVRAVVAVAPVGSALFPAEGLKSLDLPTLLIKASNDTTLPYPNDARYVWEVVRPRAEYIELPGRHEAFLSRPSAPEEPGMLAASNQAITEFLERTWRDSSRH
ncbi:hypothetical protein [Rhizobacter sp. Root1221]|uniref:alpha/beta hydrolase family protein n=1 Tax=Rhizobacter sp. Root1221 TaxID=1736433 RepID=UPI00070081C8|nr:hypothetical protein [Rhizobacter sp. Root1221]KQW02342.1 hypothetical protein ASC87_14075 [Rhizobacter sp. Root1221]